MLPGKGWNHKKSLANIDEHEDKELPGSRKLAGKGKGKHGNQKPLGKGANQSNKMPSGIDEEANKEKQGKPRASKQMGPRDRQRRVRRMVKLQKQFDTQKSGP